MEIKNAEKYLINATEDYVVFYVHFVDLSELDKDTIKKILAKRQISQEAYDGNVVNSQNHLDKLWKQKQDDRQKERDKYNQ